MEHVQYKKKTKLERRKNLNCNALKAKVRMLIKHNQNYKQINWMGCSKITLIIEGVNSWEEYVNGWHLIDIIAQFLDCITDS